MLNKRQQAAHYPKFSAEETLYVITPISNPIRFESRYRLYQDFEEYVAQQPNVCFVPVEMAFGDRDFVITHPNVVKVRSYDELWAKEALINIAATTLPFDWKYVAWVDGDVTFSRTDWALETIHQLQHHQLVQMFSHTLDLGPNHEMLINPTWMEHNVSFAYKYVTGGSIVDPRQTRGDYYAKNGHPGYAWAITRESFDGVGGLIDTAVVGSGDHHMALAVVGNVDYSIPENLQNSPYAEPLYRWQERAARTIKSDLGYVPGTLLHNFHGKKVNRKYQDRWSIISDNAFDPTRDVVRDYQGLWQLSGTKNKLRDDLKRYFRVRQEDSIDI